MKNIYETIWKLAKPYYEKGRPMDIAHIGWMMQEAKKICEKENIDDTILMPLVILHDVGYAVSPVAYYEKDLKKEHMATGKVIAREILEQIDYPEDKIEKISYYISVHDYWLYGKNDVYEKNKILAIFHDLDFIWLTTPEGFEAMRKVLNKTRKEMIAYIKKDSKHEARPFSTKATKQLYEQNISEIKEKEA